MGNNFTRSNDSDYRKFNDRNNINSIKKSRRHSHKSIKKHKRSKEFDYVEKLETIPEIESKRPPEQVNVPIKNILKNMETDGKIPFIPVPKISLSVNNKIKKD